MGGFMQRLKIIFMMGLGFLSLSISASNTPRSESPDPLASAVSGAALSAVSQFLPKHQIPRAILLAAWKHKKPLAATVTWNVALWGVRQLPLVERSVVGVANQIKKRVPGADKVLNEHTVTALKCAPLIYLGGCAVLDYIQYQRLLCTLESQLGGEGVEFSGANDVPLTTISSCIVDGETLKFPVQLKAKKDQDVHCKFVAFLVTDENQQKLTNVINSYKTYWNTVNSELGINTQALTALMGAPFDVKMTEEQFNTLKSELSRVDRLGAESLRRFQFFKALEICVDAQNRHANNVSTVAANGNGSIAASGDVNLANSTTTSHQVTFSNYAAAFMQELAKRNPLPSFEEVAQYSLALSDPQAFLKQNQQPSPSDAASAQPDETTLGLRGNSQTQTQTQQQETIHLNTPLVPVPSSQLPQNFGRNEQVGPGAVVPYGQSLHNYEASVGDNQQDNGAWFGWGTNPFTRAYIALQRLTVDDENKQPRNLR